jgi:hypothetical protein
MTLTGGDPLPVVKARATRRAAALWTHWARDGASQGIAAILREVAEDDNPETEWQHLVCAMLSLGEEALKAARDARAHAYIAEVLQRAMADEVQT